MSLLASSTSINKLQVMQNAAFCTTATGCKYDTNIQHLHDETLMLPIKEHLQLPASQTRQKAQHAPIVSPTYIHAQQTPHVNHGSKTHNLLQLTIYTTNIPTDPRTVTTTDIQANMSLIHAYIVSKHCYIETITRYCAPQHLISAALK